MANRRLVQFAYGFERMPVQLYAQVAIGAVGAPTLNVANSKGIASITRTGVGAYTVTLQDGYNRLMFIDEVLQNATGIPAGVSLGIVTAGTNSATGIINIQFSTGGTATEVVTGDTLYLNVVLSNSSL